MVDFWADMTKTTKTLGWSPKIDIAEGIRSYVNSIGIEETTGKQ
jgi:nucleoside-diphosphate-sugar epimerase